MREHLRCDIALHPLSSEHCIERYALVSCSIMACFCRRNGSDSEIVRARWQWKSITRVGILYLAALTLDRGAEDGAGREDVGGLGRGGVSAALFGGGEGPGAGRRPVSRAVVRARRGQLPSSAAVLRSVKRGRG